MRDAERAIWIGIAIGLVAGVVITLVILGVGGVL